MGVHLPWEVIHVVLGLLAEKHRNLSPISLACRVFLDFCRKHQFAKIIIDLPPTFLKYPDAIYCSSTRFAQLPDLSSPEPGVLEGIPPIVDNIAAVEVYTTDAAFPDVISTPFKMLTKLKSLHITDLRRSRAGSISIDLNSSLALGLRSVIYHSLKIPTFRELKLALGLDNFPLSLLRGTSVRSLALFDVLLSPEDGSQGYNTIGLAPATLSELQIHSKSVIHLINLLEASYPYNDASIDIRGLTKLDISQASPDCSSVLESMVALAPELRTVHLYSNYRQYDD
ncbi:hypothetical protein CPB83DRAFT_560278 [Crepidotus variabilis]|uniref:Uncharacterized protein n=1 Tax=Crepidotus variabilis TaxID=179855 RepID=A0A9P6E9Z3_9AGAR|nr:hypothetical protein CPB83DRAFT_560278 [Crepidotus variabilis]